MRLTTCEEVLQQSDFVSVHVPLNPSTRNLINADALSLMKPTAYLINLARGGVLDEQALLDALRDGRLAGAALDVHAEEGHGKISSLAPLSNVILTPHIGAGTSDSQHEIGEIVIDAVEKLARKPSTAVHQEPLTRTDQETTYSMSTKAKQFRQMLQSDQVEFILEAHNGLSAKIVEEAGFKGIWGSGLAISASLGVRDNNEASWTQVLDVAEFISDATTTPMMLDADTGYGNFNNVRRLVYKLEQIGVAAMCIEDKLFPKTNSFIDGEAQPLADIDEFVGKIKAAKDSQSGP